MNEKLPGLIKNEIFFQRTHNVCDNICSWNLNSCRYWDWTCYKWWVLVYTKFFYKQMFREHFNTIWEDNVRIKPPEFVMIWKFRVLTPCNVILESNVKENNFMVGWNEFCYEFGFNRIAILNDFFYPMREDKANGFKDFSPKLKTILLQWKSSFLLSCQR